MLHPTNTNALKSGVGVLTLVIALACSPLAFAAQRTFATPEAAVNALIAALKSSDEAALREIFGDGHEDLINSGDRAADSERRSAIAKALETYRVLRPQGENRRVLLVGTRAWPLPIPLERSGDNWRFATELGAEEIINRRIGANERNAIDVLRAYVDAQRRYASVDRDGDGVLSYARKLLSSPGKRDGLYWPTGPDKDDEMSPFGPLLAESSTFDPVTRQGGEPYQGYHFRILSAQGQHAAGGAYSYLINGRMVAGFALVAWPHDHGATGLTTFIVNHNGKVFEKDLGPQTAGIAAKLTRFDPGPGWRELAR